MNRFFLILSALLIVGCPEKRPQPADCDPGYLPCVDDNSECCDVECENGYQLCGEDSTECCEVICDEGFHICGIDSNECCLDTSSHNFIWSYDTLGLPGSYFRDVSIFSENEILATGKIITDSGRFNLAHWDGVEWKLERIVNPSSGAMSRGNVLDHYDNNDLLLLAGWLFRYSNLEWTKIEIPSNLFQQGLKNFCINENNLTILVGNNGSIASYDGLSFVDESFGISNDLTNITCKYGLAIAYNNSNDCTILMKKNNNWEELTTVVNYLNIQTNQSRIYTVFIGQDKIFIDSNAGLIEYDIVNDTISHNETGSAMLAQILSIYSAGNNYNDIWYIGNYGDMVHYNGQTWYQLNADYDFIYYPWNIRMDGDIVCSVGSTSNFSKAVIAIGKRNE